MPSKQVEDVYNAGGFDGGPLGRPETMIIIATRSDGTETRQRAAVRDRRKVGSTNGTAIYAVTSGKRTFFHHEGATAAYDAIERAEEIAASLHMTKRQQERG